ncbi:glycerate kinase [Chitinilyticum piscinae]|uniref:Glycerate kinase n=1 Tax=Chitinilyticum piscinae TaxID=2866724 RepID=A0A8J7K261_9NEIS|nr:glycerate kinase [Chitinilyticum piscinae]MBE9610121.1 glycerate kinase [Chitinilyticum piscinae]
MKILIAPDSFKESLSASAAAQIIANGLRESLPDAELICLPLADGGEGTLDTLLASGGIRHSLSVQDPLGRPTRASWGLRGDMAIIEMAEASGLTRLAEHERNPLFTSSYGTGELIRAALDAGARHILLALGGSATNDGGCGMLQALGMRFLDAQGNALPAGGAALARLVRIDMTGFDARLSECRFEAACDVDNPLTGNLGASAVFGPQKGATAAMVAELDTALANYAERARHLLGRNIAGLPGAGAAGGLGAAAAGFFNAQLRRGADMVMDAVGLDAQLANTDLLITGEGRLDGQSCHGKVAVSVARRARAAGVPVIALAGCFGEGVDTVHEAGIAAAFASVDRCMDQAEALHLAHANLARLARNIGAMLSLSTCCSSRFGSASAK